MRHSQETFVDLVDEAHSGTLQLPAFQRDWKWERNKVISLYDSLRKNFPVGNFLLLKRSPQINLSPRLFEGSSAANGTIAERLTLDGQQRITAGIALLYGMSGSALRYFIDLAKLHELATSAELDINDDESVLHWVQDIDDGDNYIKATTRRTTEEALLLDEHLLPTIYLRSETAARRAMERYLERYPERRQFIDYVVVPHFALSGNIQCPVITLDEEESLAAITKIFATINTTGKRLTPVEIVTAILYAHDVDMKAQVREFHDASDVLKNIDPVGEILLQTVALLAGESPKKALLPKTITHERFLAYYQEALSLLDEVGLLLSKNLGAGLTETNKLIPYDSILAPMARVYRHVKTLTGERRAAAERKLEEWFVGSALSQRYQEGVHNKQENDAKDFLAWIKQDSQELKPHWLMNVEVPRTLKLASPTGALGRLVKCLINREHPTDPVREIRVGYFPDAAEQPQDHHLWPKKFCTDHIQGWNPERDNSDVALNLLPVSASTNKQWDKMNPADQIAQIREKIGNRERRVEVFGKLLLNDDCVAILERNPKRRQDFEDFIESRFQLIIRKLGRWDFTREGAGEPIDGDDSAQP